MQSARVLVIFLLLIGAFSPIGVGACPQHFSHSQDFLEPLESSPDQNNSKSKILLESQLKSFVQESSYNSEFQFALLDDSQATETISTSGLNLPSASFFKIRSQLYPDYFVKDCLGFGEVSFLKVKSDSFKIKPEWYLSTTTRSSKRISGWKQSNLTANSKIYPQSFLTYI